MSNLIDRQEAIDAIDKSNFNEDEQDSIYRIIEAVPSAEAIPISWIEERIENAINAKQTLIAQMWQELIDGYRRETDERH